MIMTHALGDCISPAIVGAISVAISDSNSLEAQFVSLQRALFVTPFVCVLGAFSFCMCSLYLIQAKDAVQQAVEVSQLVRGTFEVPSQSEDQEIRI
ncbi:Transporter spinster [Fasciola gigantica]|uniref:Transporter spinster n=1 Tax=Fasciola gigantica TaxID=46835 RepID=A0A504YGK1_FASGI|nr:Transporter spinster [Fasciola gigantica]